MLECIKEFIFSYELNLIFRIIVACLCGVVIGFERKSRAKNAGMRTHCIVACASAMMMVVSKYGFGDLIEGIEFINADVRLDPSRMAQGIVTGVGFLGSGMIFHQRGTTQGLTTAAGVWATSGIGMALGAGMYTIGISSTLIILLVQCILHTKKTSAKVHKTKVLKFYDVGETGFQEKMMDKLHSMGINVLDVYINKKEENQLDYSFYIELTAEVLEEELVNIVSYNSSLKYVS